MNLISHRGNLNGSIAEKENSPSYIDEAIKSGFHVEIDLFAIGKTLFLGHDFPQYKIDEEFLEERSSKLLIHAKNISAATILADTQHHFFFHSSDKFTLTSKKYIWVHDFNITTDKKTKVKSKFIIPLITNELIDAFDNKNIYAICSDYVTKCNNKFNNENK